MEDLFYRILCLVICWNVLNSPVTLVTAKCDQNIEIVQPAIAGYNVTLMFSPLTTGRVSWYRNEQTTWRKLNNTSNFVQYQRNGTHYLIITDSKIGVDDKGYYVKHLNGTNTICSSTPVKLKLVEPPSKPTLSPLKDVGDCKKCIVGEDKQRLTVKCDVNGGSEPFTVKMKVGEIIHEAKHVFLSLNSTQHHMTYVTCTVTSTAANITLTTKAYIYVMKLSKVAPSLHIPNRLIEGQPVNITCLVPYVRPPATNITMYIDGTALDGLEIKQELNNVTLLYKSWVTLTKFQRNWNIKDVTCCEYNEEFLTDDCKKCSAPETVDYAFPPDHVTLQMHEYIERNTHYEIIKLICFINNSNPQCNASFQAPEGIILIQGFESRHGDESFTSIYSALINVSNTDNGKMVKCTPACEVHFEDLPSSTWSISVASNASMGKTVDSRTDSRLPVKMIAGIGGAVVLVAICVAIILLRKHRKPKVIEEEEKDECHEQDGEEMYKLVQRADRPGDNDGQVQMVYADLEFDASAASSSNRPIIHRESQVDYADIDMINSAEISTKDTIETEEIIYINQ